MIFATYKSYNILTKMAKNKIVLPTKVMIIGTYALQFGGWDEDTIYDVVKSPDPKYKNDVWVFSHKKNEPVRVLKGEYIDNL